MWQNDTLPPVDDFRGIQFIPDPNFDGDATIYFDVNDNGFAGKGLPCSAKANHTVSVGIGRTCYPFCGACCMRYEDITFVSFIFVINYVISDGAGGKESAHVMPCAHSTPQECDKRGGLFMSSSHCDNDKWTCEDEYEVMIV